MVDFLQQNFPDESQKLKAFLPVCAADLYAEEIWLFGSRARLEHHEYSDWDILVICKDDAPVDIEDPVLAYHTRRKSGLNMDLLTVKKSEHEEAKHTLNTLCHIVDKEGVRIY